MTWEVNIKAYILTSGGNFACVELWQFPFIAFGKCRRIIFLMLTCSALSITRIEYVLTYTTVFCCFPCNQLDERVHLQKFRG